MKVKPITGRARRTGEPPLNRVGVYDEKDRLVGHVGLAAGAPVAARLLGKRGAKLKRRADGRAAWCL